MEEGVWDSALASRPPAGTYGRGTSCTPPPVSATSFGRSSGPRVRLCGSPGAMGALPGPLVAVTVTPQALPWTRWSWRPAGSSSLLLGAQCWTSTIALPRPRREPRCVGASVHRPACTEVDAACCLHTPAPPPPGWLPTAPIIPLTNSSTPRGFHAIVSRVPPLQEALDLVSHTMLEFVQEAKASRVRAILVICNSDSILQTVGRLTLKGIPVRVL